MTQIKENWIIVAQKEELTTEQTTMYLNLMILRFPNEDNLRYCATWAIRIKNGSAYERGDLQTQRALLSVGWKE